MFKPSFTFAPNFTLVMTAFCLTLGVSPSAFAQSTNGPQVIGEATPVKRVVRKRIKRDVQPVPYWVEAASLKLRDNPVAGRIIGNLSYGQKVMAYDQYENWIRTSKLDAKQQWVNSDFLSNTSLSWANYNRPTARAATDFVPVRIKDPEDRKNRLFGVRLKKSETGNALITTQKQSEQGRFFQNRFVSCDGQEVVGVRLIGEGSTFLRAQNDPRNLGLDIYAPEQVDHEANNSGEAAIAKFACKSQAF